MGHVGVRLRRILRTAFALSLVLLATGARSQRDPLPSWNAGAAKKNDHRVRDGTTEKSNTKYVEPKDHITTFDQDGTLWTQHPDVEVEGNII